MQLVCLPRLADVKLWVEGGELGAALPVVMMAAGSRAGFRALGFAGVGVKVVEKAEEWSEAHVGSRGGTERAGEQRYHLEIDAWELLFVVERGDETKRGERVCCFVSGLCYFLLKMRLMELGNRRP